MKSMPFNSEMPQMHLYVYTNVLRYLLYATSFILDWGGGDIFQLSEDDHKSK